MGVSKKKVGYLRKKLGFFGKIGVLTNCWIRTTTYNGVDDDTNGNYTLIRKQMHSLICFCIFACFFISQECSHSYATASPREQDWI